MLPPALEAALRAITWTMGTLLALATLAVLVRLA